MEKNFLKVSAFAVIVSFIAAAIAGIALVCLVPVKGASDAKVKGLSISFSCSKSSPRNVELLVSDPLEQLLVRHKGLENVYSLSRDNGGYINARFSEDTDIDRVRLELSAEIRRIYPSVGLGATMPTVSVHDAERGRAGTSISYTFSSSYPSAVIGEYINEHIVPVLANTEGVNGISVNGRTESGIELTIDFEQLEAAGLGIDDVTSAISSRFGEKALGRVTTDEEGQRRNNVYFCYLESDTLDLSRIDLHTRAGAILPLSKVATVSPFLRSESSKYRVNGLNTVYVDVNANPDANQILWGSRVKTVMKELEAALPADYEMHLEADPTTEMKAELYNVVLRCLISIIVLIVFIWIFAWNLRYALLIFISTAISLAIAGIFYYFGGVEIHPGTLAAITVSLNLMIDNIIVMSEHMRITGNRRAFMPMLAATLTTLCALASVFFLDRATRAYLNDFAIVIIINLMVSLAVAAVFVPSLFSQYGLPQRMQVSKRGSRKGMRIRVRLRRIYSTYVSFTARHKIIVFAVLLLAFGLPVYLLPEHIAVKKSPIPMIAGWYNKTLGSEVYKRYLKQPVDKYLGGSLYYFVNRTDKKKSDQPSERGNINISLYLAEGSPREMLEVSVRKMESFLSTEESVESFKTSIKDDNEASLSVTPKENSSVLAHKNIVERAMIVGGGGWSVTGPGKMNFSTTSRVDMGGYTIQLTGYNYEELLNQAAVIADSLRISPRVQNIGIIAVPELEDYGYSEYFMNLNRRSPWDFNIQTASIFSDYRNIRFDDVQANVQLGKQNSAIYFTAANKKFDDIWSFMNVPYADNSKLSGVSSIEKRKVPQMIFRENQQYVIYVRFDYLGEMGLCSDLMFKTVDSYNASAPMGYMASIDSSTYHQADKRRIILLVIFVIICIFFMSAILFNSLRKPFVLLLLVPVSFIGVFLAFGYCGVEFDNGGTAALILLCGITVNGGIYLLYEYESLKARYPAFSPMRLWNKTLSHKLMPIFLTIFSTVLGFMPFLFGEIIPFWTPLAMGTVGGLCVSLISLILILPVFIQAKKHTKVYRAG